MEPKHLITYSHCDNEIPLFEGERMTEDAGCWVCGKPLTILGNYSASLHVK